MTNRPATQLPWKSSPWHVEEADSAIRGADGYALASAALDKDATYIAHACNAYPRLVECLRETADKLDSFSTTQVREGEFLQDLHCHQQVLKARSLLRDLGELE